MEPAKLRANFLELINQARCHPSQAAENIYATFSNLYHDDELHAFNKIIQTFQGIAALEDLCKALKKSKGVDSLIPSDPLCKVAQRIAEEKGLTGRTDHDSPQQIYERISVLASVTGSIGELIALKAHTGEEIASYFMLDDGLATRKRRRMLLDPKFRYIGVGSASHKQHEAITVIILTEQIGTLKMSEAYSGTPQVKERRDMGQSAANSYFKDLSVYPRESDHRYI